jgi:hypothetical protein
MATWVCTQVGGSKHAGYIYRRHLLPLDCLTLLLLTFFENK